MQCDELLASIDVSSRSFDGVHTSIYQQSFNNFTNILDDIYSKANYYFRPWNLLPTME
jgi:hypothetical protein